MKFEIGVTCSFPGVDGEQALTGRIRQIHEDQQEAAIGLEFVKPDRKIESIIGEHIKSVMSA